MLAEIIFKFNDFICLNRFHDNISSFTICFLLDSSIEDNQYVHETLQDFVPYSGFRFYYGDLLDECYL